MDDDGGLQNWGYYEQQMKGNLALQLMSIDTPDRTMKPHLSNGGFLHRVPEPSIRMEFMRDGWIHRTHDNNQVNVQNYPSYGVLQPRPKPQTMQEPELETFGDESAVETVEEDEEDEEPKKRPRGRPCKQPKLSKPKKAAAKKAKAWKRNAGLVINGVDVDISGMPTPVCSCTGEPQQCYKWGVGGWQSACCTNTVSEYPLPLSTKRSGVRIAGRKMSQGAFKKVLEKFAGEGYDFSDAIDLKGFWAKHGTNKFVTIR